MFLAAIYRLWASRGLTAPAAAANQVTTILQPKGPAVLTARGGLVNSDLEEQCASCVACWSLVLEVSTQQAPLDCEGRSIQPLRAILGLEGKTRERWPSDVSMTRF